MIDSLFKFNRLAISFSGGRTSAVMTKKLVETYSNSHDIKITFANTGSEHPATLEFVHQCETYFGWDVTWVEAKVNPKMGKGVRHSVVDYETASRDHEPFEAAVKKYGIFNNTTPACTSRLKTSPMESYLKSLGWRFGKNLSHATAIGIRADEMDRQSPVANKFGFVYPLISWGMTKRDVGLEIRKWPFDLEIPHDAHGNCVWCWKKSHRKHLTLAQEDPSIFDFPKKCEEKYGHLFSHKKAADENGRTWWFRLHRSVKDILREAKEGNFKPYTDDLFRLGHSDFDEDLDVGGGCGESCEIGTDAAYEEQQLLLFND